MFTAAVKDFGVLETNPMFKVRMPTQPQGRIRYLDDGERERLLLACQSSKNEHLYGLVLCAISTGMRCGELLNIRYGDCDLERGVIHLEHTKTKRRRAVPLTGKALEMLRAMSYGHRPEEHVFPATNRQAPFRSYKKAWEFARKRAGIENYHFHDNRHSAGSYLAQQGVSLYTIGTILGHVSPVSTAIYAHLSTDTLRDALETMTKAKF